MLVFAHDGQSGVDPFLFATCKISHVRGFGAIHDYVGVLVRQYIRDRLGDSVRRQIYGAGQMGMVNRGSGSVSISTKSS